ncbi:MAG: T9SS type A sorting domain-containing protein [Fibrobacteria bacterium]|nr:T9SS type A sorting domain-containing protein [Fibrobacteria bacterium]
MIRIVKIIIPVVLLNFLISYSQTILLKGRVVDSSASPLSGVAVSLLNAGKSDVTDLDGKFLISNSTSGISLYREYQGLENISVKGNILSFSLNVDGRVSIDLFDMHGKLMSHVFSGAAKNGRNQLVLPSSTLSPGVYVLSARTVNNTYQHKFFFSGSYWAGNVKQNSDKNLLQKAAAGVDSLIFSLHGKVCLKLELSAYEDSLADIVLDLSSAFETFTDERDGKIYKKVTIGTQTWMAENLNFVPVKDGESWCYGDDSTNCDTYGRLYNYYTVLSNKNGNGTDICPTRWRAPTVDEWHALVAFVGGKDEAGGRLKSSSAWDADGSTDDFRFNWLPGGFRASAGGYSNEGSRSYLWLDVLPDAWGPYVRKGNNAVFENISDFTDYGFSVRCIEDTSNYKKIDTSTQTLTDYRDGQMYKIVTIGNQTWMAENLNYKPPTGNTWCYNNDTAKCAVYGRLYDWPTTMTDFGNDFDVCPNFWHVPTDEEFKELEMFAGLTREEADKWEKRGDSAGTKLKSADQWNGTDEFGFAALASGGYYPADSKWPGSQNINIMGWMWTSTPRTATHSYFHRFQTGGDIYYEWDRNDFGYSVRCIRDASF